MTHSRGETVKPRAPDMKQINAFPMIMMLIVVLFLTYWLGGFGG